MTLKELEKVSVWDDQNPKEVTKLLAPQLNIDQDVLETASRRRPYGVISVDQAIINEQQNVADTFFKLELIKKQIQVSELMTQNPLWLPEGMAKV